jgi:outer membrane protein insertion porin family
MINNFIKLVLFLTLFISITISSNSNEKIGNIIISGNNRIANETIEMFAGLSDIEILDENSINKITKNLYKTSYFENIEIEFKDNILNITVKEYPIVRKIKFEKIKSKTIKDAISKNVILKEKTPFNEFSLKKDKETIILVLKNFGYYKPQIDFIVKTLDSSLVDLTVDITLGEKTKVKKISFIGNKKFKDRKLRRIIASEEYKFWKIISGKKFLNEELVNFDKRLLKNFYINKGYYNVSVNSAFAKTINEEDFELIFNIDAGEKIYFNDLKLITPNDFDDNNFKDILNFFKDTKGEPYSINIIDDILEKIDNITELAQYQFIKATVTENVYDNKIDLEFKINETEKFYTQKINIFGNNVTKEKVIRNQLVVDEGDPFNEILLTKSINNLKSLNFFKDVTYKVVDANDYNSKIINISVQEKATGEISAAAGIGTDGGSIGMGVKENNFLGEGISLDSNIQLSTNSVKGLFSVQNPNFNNSDKSVYFTAESSETDNYTTFGYKTNKTGFSVGTSFEYYDHTFLGIGTSNMYEKIETDSTASELQRSQEGNYWDTFLKLDFDYDKRNQKFQASSGFRSYYSIDMPVISETNTLTNRYNYTYYTELFENNISTFSLFLEAANSISSDNIKLSERVKLSSNKLRGFASGSIGPTDGEDFIGGNYAFALNFNSTIPQIFEESQNVDFIFFIDAANVWGVDYNPSLDNGSKIRSSTGVGLDWFTPIGPLNFSLAVPLTTEDSDKTEKFRFNLGTTF